MKTIPAENREKSVSKRSWVLPSLTSAVTVATVASLVVGCTQAKIQVVASESHANLLAAAGQTAEAADEFARIGELLMMPEGLEYADKMFDKALSLDSTNAKAHFYKASTIPVLTLRGFIPRVERLLTDDKDNEGLERLREEITKLKMPEVSTFANKLPAGEQPFVTYYDVQRFMREKLMPAAQAALVHLNAVDTTQPLKLNFTPARLSIDPTRSSYDYSYSYTTCTATASTGYSCTYNNSYSYHYESPKLRNEYFVDQHDMKILRASQMAVIDSIRIGTGYSMRDSEYLIRRLKAVDKLRRGRSGTVCAFNDSNGNSATVNMPGTGFCPTGKGLTAEDVVKVVREFDGFLVLEQDHQFGEIAKSTGQALKNALELASMRAELCDSRKRNDGNSLVHPICIEADVVDALQIGSNALNGPTDVKMGRDSEGREIRIVIDYTAILKNPPKDLKALLPVTFDAAGAPVDYPDATLGGLFPNGDLISKLKKLVSTDRERQMTEDLGRAVRRAKDHI